MGKPGPGNAHYRIIDRPELKSWWHHCAECLLTSLLWVLWIYWMLPVFALVMYAFGVRYFYDLLSPEFSFGYLYIISLDSFGVLLAVVGLLTGWVSYNYLLAYLRKGDRRKISSPRTGNVFGTYLAFRPDQLKRARSSRRVEAVISGLSIRFVDASPVTPAFRLPVPSLPALPALPAPGKRPAGGRKKRRGKKHKQHSLANSGHAVE